MIKFSFQHLTTNVLSNSLQQYSNHFHYLLDFHVFLNNYFTLFCYSQSKTNTSFISYTNNVKPAIGFQTELVQNTRLFLIQKIYSTYSYLVLIKGDQFGQIFSWCI